MANYCGIHVMGVNCKFATSSTSTNLLSYWDSNVRISTGTASYTAQFWCIPDEGYTLDLTSLHNATSGARVTIPLGSDDGVDQSTYYTVPDTPFTPESDPTHDSPSMVSRFTLGGTSANYLDEASQRFRISFGANVYPYTNYPTAGSGVSSYAAHPEYYLTVYVTAVQAEPSTQYTATAGTVSGCTLYGTGTFNSGATVNLTAVKTDDSYEDPIITIKDSGGTIIQSGASPQSITITEDLTVDAIATPKTVVTVTQNLTHCTSSWSAGSAYQGDTLSATFTADNDYQMSSVTAEIAGSVVASGVDSISVQLTGDVTITATATAIPTAAITQSLSNCTSDLVIQSAQVGTEISVSFTANNGYQMSACSAEIAGSVVASGVDSLSFTLTDDVTITATAVQAAGLTITESLDAHITSDFVGGSIASGTTVTIHYTPSQGYDIGMYSCVYTGTYNDYTINDTYDTETGILTIEVTVTADITIEITAVAEDTSLANTFLNVYLPTDAELRTLAHDRFRSYVSSKSYDGTQFTSLEDKARSVLALYKTFFPITPMPNETYRVYYGYYGTAVYTECAFYDKETLDCGTVAVAEITHDSLDYQCVASIYLPFIGMRTIDIKNIMGQSVNLKYEFNVYDGSCLACLSNNVGMFQTEAGYIREDIPYILRENAGSLVMNSYYALDKTPYILIQHDRLANSNNTFGKRTDVTAVVNTLSGYNVIDEINLPNNARMSENEYNLILMRLKAGVII